MRTTLLLLPLAIAGLTTLTACQQSAANAEATATTSASATAAAAPVEDLTARGEYLIRAAGCNDCHTSNYGERQGEVDKSEWLTGSPLGFKGPWGTTYAANLRLKLADMTEVQWLDYSGKLHTRPIMPDYALRAMSEDDRRAIYRFIKTLGPSGQPAPAYLPPGQTPPAPYYELILPAAPAAAVAAAPAQG